MAVQRQDQHNVATYQASYVRHSGVSDDDYDDTIGKNGFHTTGYVDGEEFGRAL
jgi:hypothetical protein